MKNTCLTRTGVLLIIWDCLLTTINSSTYVETRLQDECLKRKGKLRIKLKSEVNLITFNSSQISGSNNREGLHCHLELSVPSTQFGLSVFIEEMNLGSCDQDFIQFGRDILFVTTHLSRRYCGHHSPPSVTSHMGHRRFSLPPGTAANRYYTEDSDREMDVWIVLQDTTNKYLTLVVTPYKKSCKRSDSQYIQCDNSKHCVRKDLFCDGRVNCAWPHSLPADESQCKEVEPVEDDTASDSTGGVLITVLVLLLAIIGGLVSVIFYRRRTNQSLKHSTHIITRPLQGQEDLLTTQMFSDHPQSQPHLLLPPPYTSTPSQPPASAPSPPPVPSRQPPRYEVIWT